jgi:hypothetical protein
MMVNMIDRGPRPAPNRGVRRGPRQLNPAAANEQDSYGVQVAAGIVTNFLGKTYSETPGTGHGGSQ